MDLPIFHDNFCRLINYLNRLTHRVLLNREASHLMFVGDTYQLRHLRVAAKLFAGFGATVIIDATGAHLRQLPLQLHLYLRPLPVQPGDATHQHLRIGMFWIELYRLSISIISGSACATDH